MFSVETIIALLELVVESNRRTGRTTKEYKGLHALLVEGINELAPSPSGTLTPEEIQVVRMGKKLDCIKMYKDRTKESLMDSKKAVEKFMADNGM